MDKKVNIIGFTGSLRKNSYNRAALEAAKELLPEGAELEIEDISDIPFFNEDLEAEVLPESVANFRDKIAGADALLISTPEYNYSLPPVLKNALDWASRGKDAPVNGKYLAIMSASPSMLGGARVQYHLRQVCVGLNLIVINKPEVFINFANTKFDENGKLTDEKTKNAIGRLIQTLVNRVKESK